MTTLQQALINAKLIKVQTPKAPVQISEHNHDEDMPTLGINEHGNRQYYFHGECVCPNCLERYVNVFLGDECRECQIQEINHAVF